MIYGIICSHSKCFMYFCINNVTVTYNYALYTKSMFFISPLHSLDKNYDKKAFFLHHITRFAMQ